MVEDFSDKNKDYGLPKVDPQPIQRDQPVLSQPRRSEPSPPKKNNKTIIIVLSIVVALILASLLYMIFWENGSQEIPTTTPKTEDRVVMEDEVPDESVEIDEETPVITDEPGSIVTISERTNRYYIFVGSYKFRAYAHRHAEKLAADGFAVKLITPDNWVGMRVAVGSYANEQEAQSDAGQIRSRYGTEVVISKY